MAQRISFRKIILFALNLLSTVLTLMTGLRENPLIVFVTGRYDLVRSRFMESSINYNNLRDEALNRGVLPNLYDVGQSYRFVSAPRRTPANLGEDRSTCLRVNSMNVSMMSLNFDDFWGYGPRRAQVFIFSISAPKCDVINFQPKWIKQCVTTNGDQDKCNRYILDNFDTLMHNRVIQAGVEKDFGMVGEVYLRCAGRPERTFQYNTDLMVPTSFWAGGSYHVELQSSLCLANPVLRNPDWQWGLFKAQPKDQGADVVFAVDNSGWFVTIVSIAYGIVAIVMMLHGILAMVLRLHTVVYLPYAARFLGEQRFLKYIFPFMSAALQLPHDENLNIRFKGSMFMASDVWMNHWLYVSLSILEAVVNIRTAYVVLTMGTWMLTKKANLENFIFLCSALTKVTWIMCLVHTLIRAGLKLALSSTHKLKLIRPKVRETLEWYVDAYSLFVSYKIYSLMLCVVLYTMWIVHGTTTLMVRQAWYKQGVFGGAPNITQFWGSEIICDLFILFLILTGCGFIIGSLMLLTRYRSVTHNKLITILQQRYFFVGWDVFIAIEALGIDPYNKSLVEDGVAQTNCSLGSVLQQLYTSGCSGYVHLACDHIFMERGLSKEPPKLSYPMKRAAAMGLYQSRPGTNVSTVVAVSKYNDARSTAADSESTEKTKSVLPKSNKSLFNRKLTLVTEGYTGKIIFVDEDEAGCVVNNPDTGRGEFVVMDAISQVGIMDIKPLLGGQKPLHIR